MTLPTNLQKAKAQLVINHPFFSSILFKRAMVKSELVPTMGVDIRGNIYYNEKFVAGLTVPELVFLMAHEVMHVVGQHVTRMGEHKAMVVGMDGRPYPLWFVASDAWINDTLKEAGVGQFIEGGVDMPGSKSKDILTIYNEMLLNLKDVPSNSLGNEFVDTGESLTSEEIKAIQAQNKIDIASAAAAAKARGKLPGNLERLVEEIIHVKTPWYDHLERYMTSLRNTDNSWNQPNRRFKAHGYYLPIRKSEGSMGEMVVGIDTSGSIDAQMLAYFGGHLNRIIELCQPEKVHVVYCDGRVNTTEEYTSTDYPISLKAVGGGGTDLREIFNWIEEQGIEPSCVVILTDGYTPFPESVDYPTIWAMTTDAVAPDEAGQTIRVDAND